MDKIPKGSRFMKRRALDLVLQPRCWMQITPKTKLTILPTTNQYGEEYHVCLTMTRRIRHGKYHFVLEAYEPDPLGFLSLSSDQSMCVHGLGKIVFRDTKYESPAPLPVKSNVMKKIRKYQKHGFTFQYAKR